MDSVDNGVFYSCYCPKARGDGRIDDENRISVKCVKESVTPGAVCGDGGDFRAVHQQAYKQERRHREQGVRGDARKAGVRYPNHVCEEGNKCIS